MMMKAVPLFPTLTQKPRPAFTVCAPEAPTPTAGELALKQELAELAAVKAQYQSAVRQLATARESVISETMSELRELVFAVGRELAMKDLTADSSAVSALLSDLLASLGGGRGFEVRMASEDAERVHLPAGSEVRVTADESLQPGSCVVTRADVSIDASFTTRERQVRDSMGLQ